MASDGRYIYQPPINTANYDYSSYPPPPQPYDNAQIPQPPRQMRAAPPTHPQSPHQPYNPPSQAYPPPPNYGPNTYMTHPSQPPPQWTGDNWAHYNQSYAHQHPPPPPPSIPGPEAQYGSLPVRQESGPSSSNEPRGYISSHPDSRRLEERPPPPNSQPPQPSSARRRDRESPPAASPVMDDANNISSGPGRPPLVEQLDRMLNSATQGAQTLEAIRSAVETGPSMLLNSRTSTTEKIEPEEQVSSANVPQNGNAGPSKAQKSEDNNGGSGQEGQKCLGCKATSTPEWRRGPLGPRTLCNACGLVYAKIIKRRVRDQVSGKANGEHSSQDAREDSGDSDDDEYDSQGRQSEGVEESGGH